MGCDEALLLLALCLNFLPISEGRTLFKTQEFLLSGHEGYHSSVEEKVSHAVSRL